MLLVEEPEAHLHPQLQDLLMHFLESEAVSTTQVIATTHSPTFASSARVERLTVLARASDDALPEARLPRDFGLDHKQLAYLRRFLRRVRDGSIPRRCLAGSSVLMQLSGMARRDRGARGRQRRARAGRRRRA